MNVSRRRYMGGVSKPYDAEVTYISASGGARIQTDYVPKGYNISIETKMNVNFPSGSSWNTFYWAGSGVNTDAHYVMQRNNTASTTLTWHASNKNMGHINSGGNQNTDLTIQVYNTANSSVASGYKQTCIVNGTSYTANVQAGSENERALYIFNNVNGRIYYFRVKDNGVVVLDLVPVRIGIVGYMYDKVSGKLYGNANSSGSFSVGDDIQRIEYLESTGTQYIDTGIKASGNLSIRISLIDYFTEQHKGTWPFGGRNSWKNKCFGYYILSSNYADTCLAYGNTEVFDLSYSTFPASSVLEIGGGVLKIGNHTKSYSQQTFTSDYNLILFGLQNGGTPILWGFKIGETYISNGTITRDLIPVRIGQVGYLYDRVSREFFGNAGTGDFVLGADINE